MNSLPQRVAIIGSGTAAHMLASLLTEKGCKVGIFERESNREKVAFESGETLQPAIIPSLQEIKVEDYLKPTSKIKSGVTVYLDEEVAVNFSFLKIKSRYPHYAYHTPLHLLNAALKEASKQAGARTFPPVDNLIYDASDDSFKLSEKSLSDTEGYFEKQPDWIIISDKNIKLPHDIEKEKNEFSRNECILSAYHDGLVLKYKANLHIDRYSHGWGWRIPLPGREALGIVISKDLLPSLGNTPEEQYDTFLERDSFLSWASRYARRLTPVSYSSYDPFIYNKLAGKNWALIGSAAAYIDPVFSNQAGLEMKSAVVLADIIEKEGGQSLSKYQMHYLSELFMWQRIVDLWYDGRLGSLFRLGKNRPHIIIGKMVHYHVTRHMGRIFTGEMGEANYSRNLLWFMTDYGLNGMVGKNPTLWAIKS